MTTINIVSTSDDNYAQHLGVMLVSLFENNRNNTFNIFVIDGNISEKNKHYLSLITSKYSVMITYVRPDFSLFKNAVINNHISEAAYYRLSIAELIPPNIKKILYLDSDIVICDNVLPLWNIALGENVLAAMADPWAMDNVRIKINSRAEYFNSGVMLINLDLWRRQNIGEKCIEFLNTNREQIVLYDQDVLNVVLHNKWQSLEVKFNCMSQFFDRLPLYIFDKKVVSKAKKHPIILHFSHWKNLAEPWDYLCRHPLKNKYIKYMSMTSWKDTGLINGEQKHGKKYFIEKYVPVPVRKLYEFVKRHVVIFVTNYIIKIITSLLCKQTDDVLIVKIDQLGDLIILSPTLKYYRIIYPDKKITMIVKETNACFAQRLVEDKIIDAYLIVANKYLNKSYLFDFKLIYILTRQTYYAVIHPTFSRLEIGDSIMRMTRSKNKIGFLGDPSTMEQNTKRRNDICIYSRLIEVPKNMTREIDRNWHFIKMLGAKTTVESVPKIVCRNLDDKKAFSLLKKHSIDQKTFCVIFPGASERLRMWPEEKFAKLASIIVSKGITPIICGKSLEMEIAKRIKAVESNSIIMCNETDIWTLASILKQSIFYVGNDTGIAHLSAAVGTPTICIIGGGHFERFFPYGDRNINRIVYNHNITCKYDNWKCSPTTNRPAPCLSSVEVSCVEREISNLLETLHINK